jgi:hypothetical protein
MSKRTVFVQTPCPVCGSHTRVVRVDDGDVQFCRGCRSLFLTEADIRFMRAIELGCQPERRASEWCCTCEKRTHGAPVITEESLAWVME